MRYIAQDFKKQFNVVINEKVNYCLLSINGYTFKQSVVEVKVDGCLYNTGGGG